MRPPATAATKTAKSQGAAIIVTVPLQLIHSRYGQAAELLECAMAERIAPCGERGGDSATGDSEGEGEGEVGLEAVLRAIEGGMLKVWMLCNGL